MMTVDQIINAFKSGEKSAEEITRGFLDVIAQKNPEINAFVEVFETVSANTIEPVMIIAKIYKIFFIFSPLFPV